MEAHKELNQQKIRDNLEFITQISIWLKILALTEQVKEIGDYQAKYLICQLLVRLEQYLIMIRVIVAQKK